MGGETRLSLLTGRDHAEALAARATLAEMALVERNTATATSGKGGRFAGVAEYAADLAGRTVCLTLLAGSGSRWVKSLAAARERGEREGDFDPARPRALYPVRDYLGPGGGMIPIAAYALAASKGLGRHLIVVRGWEREIDAQVLAAVGIDARDRDFFTQDAPYDKPLGHGDAAWQCRALWKDADYVVTNFGGDANSRRTLLSSLLVLDALNSGPSAPAPLVGLLMPAAAIHGPAYPIVLDSGGLPRSFGHAKLQGHEATAGSGYTNVGVRAYRAADLLEKVDSFRSRYWVEGRGYAIPGNDPEGREFALDNVDAELAAEGRARILAAALPEELTPAKSLDDIGAFEEAVRTVTMEAAL